MSLKQEIESWVEALKCYDDGEFEKALELFEQNADTSKIYFNIGMIHATLGEHERAVEAYQRATKLDTFLAVAYFQMGVSNFLLGEFVEAMANFNESLLYLRGNTLIDYEQLGLKFRLYSCEVLFNRGLCYIYNQDIETGMKDLDYAAKEKQVEDHSVIDEAIKEQAEGYTVFSVGVGVLYRPNESKVRNVATKDYLGKARLVAASDAQNAFTGFTGAEVKKTELVASSPADDRLPGDISFAASNLVKPELQSRRKSVEEPPPTLAAKPSIRGERGERGFPPTPPPENDFAPSKPIRANTVAGAGMGSGMGPGSRSMSMRGDPNRGPPRGRMDDGYGPPARRPTELAPPEPPRRAYTTRAPTSNVSSRSRSVREGPRSDVRGDTRGDMRGEMAPLRVDPRRPPPPSRTMSEYSDEVDGNPYNDDLYDMYNSGGSQRGGGQGGSVRRGPSRRAPPSAVYPDEEEYASDAYEGSSFDEGEFEMLEARSPARANSRRPEVKKIKVKCHDGDDTRMILIATTSSYVEFMQRLKEKFGYRKNAKCKVKDEDGDGMITLQDDEDLEIAISTAKKLAIRERAEHGKLEVWVSEA